MQAAGVDIGSSAVKVGLFDLEASPRLIQLQSAPCPLRRPQADQVEHDLKAIEGLLRRFLDNLPDHCSIGFTTAMHGLVLLDHSHRPLGNCLAWADGRAAKQALRLKAIHPQAQARTGTPLHPMAWPAKILWQQEREPERWRKVARLTDLKGYLMERILGEPLPLDLSSASCTGLWNQQEAAWDQEILNSLHLDPEVLPCVELEPQTRIWQSHEIHLGAGDGPIANLGMGAIAKGRIAVSLGTSGAVRQVECENSSLAPSLFRYALDRHCWIRGGALSNGTSVLDWLQKQKGLEIEEILQRASQVPPGALGLKVYPYFSGERAPFWQPGVKSHILGWSFQHDFDHLARACIEGVAFCLQRLLIELQTSTEPLRCTGGFFASPFWRQLLADVTGQPLGLCLHGEASALGAAIMTTSDYRERALSIPVGRVIDPDARLVEQYKRLFEEWVEGEPTRMA